MAGLIHKLTSLGKRSDATLPALNDWMNFASFPAAIINSDGDVLSSNAQWKNEISKSQLPLPVNGPGVSHDILTVDGRWMRLTFAAHDSVQSGTKLVTATDISDLKTDYYRQLLDTFQDCIKVIDNKGRLIFLNPAGRRVLSVAPDQPLGMLWTSLLPPASASKVQQILEQVLSGEPAQFSNHSQFPDREAQTWHHVLTPYRGADGRVVAALCISRNITQDYDTHRATRASEERMSAAIKAAEMGIWEVDLSNGRLFCDDNWYDVTGISRANNLITIEQFFSHVHPEDMDRVRFHWNDRSRIINSIGEYHGTFRIKDAEGKIRNINATAVVIKGLADQALRAIGYVTVVKN